MVIWFIRAWTTFNHYLKKINIFRSMLMYEKSIRDGSFFTNHCHFVDFQFLDLKVVKVLDKITFIILNGNWLQATLVIFQISPNRKCTTRTLEHLLAQLEPYPHFLMDFFVFLFQMITNNMQKTQSYKLYLCSRKK